MTEQVQSKLNNLCFQMSEFTKEMALESGADAQFVGRVVSQSMAMINMRLGEQWGKKMLPIALKSEVSDYVTITSTDPSVFTIDPASVKVEIVEEAPKPAPKPKKVKK